MNEKRAQRHIMNETCVRFSFLGFFVHALDSFQLIPEHNHSEKKKYFTQIGLLLNYYPNPLPALESSKCCQRLKKEAIGPSE